MSPAFTAKINLANIWPVEQPATQLLWPEASCTRGLDKLRKRREKLLMISFNTKITAHRNGGIVPNIYALILINNYIP